MALAVVASSPATGHATFPGANGKIAFVRGGDIWTMNPDGTGQVNITNSPAQDSTPSWSPDGKRIAFWSNGLKIMNADGTDVTPVPTEFSGYDPTWSPDGTQLLYADASSGVVHKLNEDGTGEVLLIENNNPTSPSWSPDGTRIAFKDTFFSPSFCFDSVTTMDTDENTNDFFNVTCNEGQWEGVNWSPDGSKLVFSSDFNCPSCVFGQLNTIKPDRTDRFVFSGVSGQQAAWSPDGARIVYTSFDPERIKIVNADSTGVTDVTDGTLPDWQPIPINSYPRPRGATPFRASLTTAYNQCTASDRTHGPPLAFPSCASPQKSSAHLTVGTGDSNGKPALNEGYLTLTTLVGAPGGPDDADVGISLFMDDVFTNALADYTGEIRARVTLRITDKDNTPHPGGPGAATTTEIPLEAVAACTPVADPQEGSACTATTTADALAPGTVKEGRRSIWQLGRVEVYDGGADGDADTPAGDTLFATQGLFIP